MGVPLFEHEVAGNCKKDSGNADEVENCSGFLEKRNVDKGNFDNGNKCAADKRNGNGAKAIESAFYELVFVEFFKEFGKYSSVI